MLATCAVTSMLTPLSAILLARFGWGGLLPVVFLGVATFDGRRVGSSSALLELAPAAERPTYSALNTVLILPVAFLSLLAGVLLQHWSYPTLFLTAASFIAAGALLTRRLPEKNRGFARPAQGGRRFRVSENTDCRRAMSSVGDATRTADAVRQPVGEDIRNGFPTWISRFASTDTRTRLIVSLILSERFRFV